MNLFVTYLNFHDILKILVFFSGNQFLESGEKKNLVIDNYGYLHKQTLK